MSRLTALSIAVAVFATAAPPALAQNASQIASVKRGASCAGCNLFQGDFSGLEAVSYTHLTLPTICSV